MDVISDLKRLEEKYSQELVVFLLISKFRNEKVDVNCQAVIRYDVRHPVVNDADFEGVEALTGWAAVASINPKGK